MSVRVVVSVLCVLVGGARCQVTPEPDVQFEFNYNRDMTSPHGVNSWPVTYAECRGQRQSPVDIQTDHVRYVPHGCPRVTFHSKMVRGTLQNTGLFAKYNVDTYDNVHLSNVPYNRGEFKFHNTHAHHGGAHPTPINASSLFAGAEHTVNGHRFEGEVHLVFYNGRYNDLKEASHYTDGIAVIALFVEIVPEEKLLDRRFSQFLKQYYPRIKEYNSKVKVDLDITMFLDRNCAFYTYHGSLTTPLCNESVTWMVLRDPLLVSDTAWAHYINLPSRGGYNEMYGNYRNTMPTNGRVIEVNFQSAAPRLPANRPLNRRSRPFPTNFRAQTNLQLQFPGLHSPPHFWNLQITLPQRQINNTAFATPRRRLTPTLPKQNRRLQIQNNIKNQRAFADRALQPFPPVQVLPLQQQQQQQQRQHQHLVSQAYTLAHPFPDNSPIVEQRLGSISQPKSILQRHRPKLAHAQHRKKNWHTDLRQPRGQNNGWQTLEAPTQWSSVSPFSMPRQTSQDAQSNPVYSRRKALVLQEPANATNSSYWMYPSFSAVPLPRRHRLYRRRTRQPQR